MGPNSFLRERYDSLWLATRERILSGTIETDPLLVPKQLDRRRGITLVIRPSWEVRQQVCAFLAELRELEPNQHYYDPAELHVTFLSLFTATEKPEPFLSHTEEYMAAVAHSLRAISPFPVAFTGVTASPGAIMIQGFTDTDRLNAARDILREVLRARDLGVALDGRYRLETAHMTVIRFAQPLRNGKRFVEVLERMRSHQFGEMKVDSLELVKNDWYMSRGITEALAHYKLAI